MLATQVSLILAFVETPQVAALELNRVNDNQYVGNFSSPFPGQATSAQAPRRVQCSLRVRYWIM